MNAQQDQLFPSFRAALPLPDAIAALGSQRQAAGARSMATGRQGEARLGLVRGWL